MAQAILDRDRVAAQPLLDEGRIDVVVVAPTFVAGVVGRVDEDAVHPAGVHRQQRLQRVQVVAVDDEVAVQPRLADRFVGVRLQRPERHRKVMVVDKLLALEI